jgi:hypothetical protein
MVYTVTWCAGFAVSVPDRLLSTTNVLRLSIKE